MKEYTNLESTLAAADTFPYPVRLCVQKTNAGQARCTFSVIRKDELEQQAEDAFYAAKKLNRPGITVEPLRLDS